MDRLSTHTAKIAGGKASHRPTRTPTAYQAYTAAFEAHAGKPYAQTSSAPCPMAIASIWRASSKSLAVRRFPAS